jgi:hypothetical protein
MSIAGTDSEISWTDKGLRDPLETYDRQMSPAGEEYHLHRVLPASMRSVKISRFGGALRRPA